MIKLAHTKEELEKIFHLRYEVLRKPWGQSYESAYDIQDYSHTSFNAYIQLEEICIACGRLDIIDRHTAQIRYMAVHPDYQGKGWGQKILCYLEDIAKDKNISHIILHARAHAIPFYLKNHYVIIKPSHVLFNAIPHYLMEKYL